jgi:hypothetical protein
VSAFQKIGTFRVQGNQKQGGNVASYFCTPSGRVLHVVAGPVDAATLLREARWVMETHKLALLESKGKAGPYRQVFRRAHAERLRQEQKIDLDPAALPDKGGSAAVLAALLKGAGQKGALAAQGQVHLLLTANPLVKIDQIYKLVFENILGEKVSTNPVAQGK